MFTMLLNEKQKVTFLKLLYYLAKSDGYIHQKEQDLIKYYLYETRIGTKDLNTEVLNLENIGQIFDDPISKNIVLFEIITLALSDHVFSKEEEDFIIRISESFGFEKSDLERFIHVSKEFIDILEKVNNLLKIN